MIHSERWPPLPLNEWQNTYRTLHMWTQIVGKIRMALSPPMNHWWHVALYVNSRGLTTGPIPYAPGIFEIQFDFQEHELNISTSEGPRATRPLRGQSVASLYSGIFEALEALGVEVEIDLMPQEIADAVPFDRDYRSEQRGRCEASRLPASTAEYSRRWKRSVSRSRSISCRRRLPTPFRSTGTTDRSNAAVARPVGCQPLQRNIRGAGSARCRGRDRSHAAGDCRRRSVRPGLQIGATRPLRGQSVASLYSGIFEALEALGVEVEIDLMPQEIADAVPFDRDY